MIRTVVEHDLEVDNGESCEIAAPSGVFNSLLHGRNKVLRNCAAENVVHELELSAPRERFHLDFAIAVLAVTTSLFLVASLNVGAAANRLAIRHLGSFQVHLRVVALFKLGN